jgi:tetratricopeptide (TPR) repeat protein
VLWSHHTQVVLPDEAETWYYTGNLNEAQQNPAAALTAYQQASQLPLSGRYALGRADIYTRLGRLWQSQGNLAEATNAYQAAVQANDLALPFNHVLMLTGLGQLAHEQQMYDTAISYYENALQVDPSYSWAYFRLGQTHVSCCQDWALAIHTIQQGVAYDPANPWGHLFLGDAYRGQGAYAQAKAAYAEALRLNPAWAEAENRLAGLSEEKP